MTKKMTLALAIGAALGFSLVNADDAQARGRNHGSCGSHGGGGSNGGSFGGLFSRRGNDCHTESYSSCGSHGGTNGNVHGEAYGSGADAEATTPPPAPTDPGGASAARESGSEFANRETAAAVRETPATLVTSNRRFGRLFR